MSQTLEYIITGRDQASESFRQVRREMLQTAKAMRTLRMYYKQQNEQLDLGLRAYGRFASTISQVQTMYTQYNTAMIRVEMVQERITDAQDAYSEALRKHGAGSREAASASDKLAKAQRDLSRAQLENKLNMVGYLLRIPYFLKNARDMIIYVKMLSAVRRLDSVAIGTQTMMTQFLTGAKVTDTAATVVQTGATGALSAARRVDATLILLQGGEVATLTVVRAAETTGILAQIVALKALAAAKLAAMGPLGWAALAIGVGVAVGTGLAAAGVGPSVGLGRTPTRGGVVREQLPAARRWEETGPVPVLAAQRGAIVEREGFIYVHPEEEIIPAEVRRRAVPVTQQLRAARTPEIERVEAQLLTFREIRLPELALIEPSFRAAMPRDRPLRAPLGDFGESARGSQGAGDISIHIERLIMDPQGQSPERAAEDMFQRLRLRIRSSRPEV